MSQVDMSDAAISRRLRLASELRDLCVSLGKSRKATVEYYTDARSEHLMVAETESACNRGEGNDEVGEPNAKT